MHKFESSPCVDVGDFPHPTGVAGAEASLLRLLFVVSMYIRILNLQILFPVGFRPLFITHGSFLFFLKFFILSIGFDGFMLVFRKASFLLLCQYSRG